MVTRQAFIELIAPIAVKLRLDNSPIFPSVRIAQAILETGGNVNAWNNLVGYKVGSGVYTLLDRRQSISIDLGDGKRSALR